MTSVTRRVVGRRQARSSGYIGSDSKSASAIAPRNSGSISVWSSSDGVLRIATNLLDVPAEVIALIFSERWAVEIFFRFFKHLLGCRHLLSADQNGIKIQTYCAIIACLLIALWTGRKLRFDHIF
ncbi:MAG: transposase [Planctomycetaceae bacterium]|nr:transposase [Planctomycetaceae bacterium]